MFTNKILNIIKQISSEKFAIVITDAASVCYITWEKTEEMYSHIWNIRYAIYTINLIVTDLVKINEIKKLITDCGKIIKFFHISYQACSILC